MLTSENGRNVREHTRNISGQRLVVHSADVASRDDTSSTAASSSYLSSGGDFVMHIQELILDGFKSYPVRTRITGWDPSFNAITGLNGSGKSNILDAICFVLGITNMTTVRAQNLQVRGLCAESDGLRMRS